MVLKKICLVITLIICGLLSYGQMPDTLPSGQDGNGLGRQNIEASDTMPCRQGANTLEHYLDAARRNSPLISDCRNMKEIQQTEQERLRSMYMRSRVEANGEYLFVPVVSRDDGTTAFKWNAQSGTDYYGYDLGESSGHLHAGVTWTQPLLGKAAYNVAKEASDIEIRTADNRIALEEHQLARSVTEHYILCRLDLIQMDYADSVSALLERQKEIISHLADNGMARQSDLRLLDIELKTNADEIESLRQSYRSHLIDLNIICGIDSGTDVRLQEIGVEAMTPVLGTGSRFRESFRLDSLSVAASLRSFNLQYRPRLDLFASGGIQTGPFSGWHRHFGVSAGLSFTLTIFDGGQRSRRERQTTLQQQTIETYKVNAEYQRTLRIGQCLSDLESYDSRLRSIKERISSYDDVLGAYSMEIATGQMSVIDYMTVLRSRIQAQRDFLVMQANRQLAVIAYNYWNW